MAPARFKSPLIGVFQPMRLTQPSELSNLQICGASCFNNSDRYPWPARPCLSASVPQTTDTDILLEVHHLMGDFLCCQRMRSGNGFGDKCGPVSKAKDNFEQAEEQSFTVKAVTEMPEIANILCRLWGGAVLWAASLNKLLASQRHYME